VDSKQWNKNFIVFLELPIMEGEIKNEKKWFKRVRKPYIAISQIFSTILLLLLLYLFSLLCNILTFMYLKQTVFVG
jgi:hypothetical protein